MTHLHPEAHPKRQKKRPISTDLNELIENKIKKFRDNSFIYLTYSVEKKSEYFTAYSLAEVSYPRVDRKQFYTMSKKGVTFFSKAENHFTPMHVWQTEYRLYRKLMLVRTGLYRTLRRTASILPFPQIATFFNFRIWKGFKVWQLGIRRRKYLAAKKFISENLFHANVPLAKALLTIRAEFCRFMAMSFVDVSQRDGHQLFYFIEAQMLTFETVRDALIDYRHRMSSVLCE